MLAAIFALVITVVTRYTGQAEPGAQVSGSVVHHSVENKQQRIEKSSFTWIVPLANFDRLKLSTFLSHVIPNDEMQVKNVYSSDVCVRPPPSLL